MSRDQKPKTRHFGGRPLLGYARRERYQICLEPRLADWLSYYGDGNRSAGIARAARAAGYADGDDSD